MAQLNIAKMKGTADSTIMKEFMDNLDPVNAIADTSPGFIWRLQDESGDATSIQAFEDPLLLVNMSVWTDFESLKTYTLKSGHLDFLKRRYEWFEKMDKASHVMWWIKEGHIPTLDEAKSKLEQLIKYGDTPDAFSIRRPFLSHENQE